MGQFLGTSTPDEKYQYDVFLCYGNNDQELAGSFVKYLTTQGVKVCTNQKLTGTEVLSTVRKSERVVHILSPSYNKQDFSDYQVNVVKEEQTRGHNFSIFITRKCDEEKIPDFAACQAPIIIDEESRGHDVEKTFKEIMYKIKGDTAMDTSTPTLPVGNVSMGLAWSYFYGYLALILPGLGERITNSKWWNQDDRKIAKRLFIMIPKSCKCPSTFHKLFSDIKEEGPLKAFKANRAGNESREYKNHVKSVKNRYGEVYYFVGEFATPVLSLFEMATGHIANIDESELDFHAKTFYLKLTEILTASSETGNYKDQFYIHYYDDTKPDYQETFQDELCDVIKTEIAKDIAREQGNQLKERSVFHDTETTVEVKDFPDPPELTGDLKFHGFWTFVEADWPIVSVLHDILTERCGLKLLNHKEHFIPGMSVLENMEKAIRESRRFIHFISPEYFKSNFAQYETLQAQERMRREGKVLSIYIVFNVPDDKLPDYIRSTTYIKFNVSKPIEHLIPPLCNALTVKDIPIKDALPCGNVSVGLAWSYTYGYLFMILPDMPSKIEVSEWFIKSGVRSIAKRYFIFIPKTAQIKESFKHNHNMFDTVGKLPPLIMQRAGVKDRPYPASVHSVTNSDGETYYFAGEFASPILTMNEMSEGRIAGLGTDAKLTHVRGFYLKLMDILQHEHMEKVHGKYFLLLYDDEDVKYMERFNDHVCDIIKAEIRRDTEKEKESE